MGMEASQRRIIQIAPMLAVTDCHFRRFFRGISHQAELWTEMQVDSTLLHTSQLSHCLDFHASEHPIVCQLGGSNPESLAAAAELVKQWNYDEVNINVGCPSGRVAGKGCFGASLMKDPERVLQIVSAIQRRVGDRMRVSVKTRTGVDREWDSLAYLRQFIQTVASHGHCRRFIIHARKAWLSGINPKKNRSVPPLNYQRVYRIAQEFSDLDISLNGGVNTLDEAEALIRCRWRPSSHGTPEAQGGSSTWGRENGNLISSSVTSELSSAVICRSDQPSVPRPLKKVDAGPLDREGEAHGIEGGSAIQPSDFEECSCSQKVDVLTSSTEGATLPLKACSSVDCSLAETAFMDRLQEQFGGLDFLSPARRPLLEGVMLGRAAYNNPCMFSCVDSRFYGKRDPLTATSPRSIVMNYMEYLDTLPVETEAPNKSMFTLLKPVLGLLMGRPGSRRYRYKLDEAIRLYGKTLSPSEVIQVVLDDVDATYPGSLDSPAILFSSRDDER